MVNLDFHMHLTYIVKTFSSFISKRVLKVFFTSKKKRKQLVNGRNTKLYSLVFAYTTNFGELNSIPISIGSIVTILINF